MKSPLPRLSAAVACLFAVALAACDDPNENTNLGSVFADTLTVYALTGTSPSFPSGYLASQGAVTRADGNFNFDVAFDINSANKVVVFPQRFVGVPLEGPKPVGLQRIPIPFDSLTRAPAGGYVFDSTFVVSPGEGLVMQVQSISDCQLYLSAVHYTKFVIDSIDAARRAVFFRTVHDPNCGYRSLVAGVVPKN